MNINSSIRKITAKLFLLCLLVMPTFVYSADENFSSIFNGKSGCFILYSLNQNKTLILYNPKKCEIESSPYSTFKIALSIMAFNQGLITQNTIFHWDKIDRKFKPWNQNQTPKTWLSNSVVWVSRRLTCEMGVDTIKKYLSIFEYGNQDFTGDPGRDNALMNAWLGSTLKISPVEQMLFLKKMLRNELFVSESSILNTENNMYLGTFSNGWRFFGKTGTGNPEHDPVNNRHLLETGWFVGFIEKENNFYIFVSNFTDIRKPKTTQPAGLRAKNITIKILNKVFSK